ncbi:MAG: hypothetical protein Q7R30_06390 [Acidobacteriota bacterium]|nr:hypothetical protein [Acidobacteriota bacterium]
MQSRILVATLALLASLVVGVAATKSAPDPVRKWAIVNLMEPTSIAGMFVSGSVMFVHDDARMARGEPCTGVYRFNPGQGPAEEIVSFHCKPRWGRAPQKFTASTARDPMGPRVLTEFQFAADEEAHRVPDRLNKY